MAVFVTINVLNSLIVWFAGTVSIRSSLQLWGTEFNALINLYRKCGMEVSALVGFRYLDLRENLPVSEKNILPPVVVII